MACAGNRNETARAEAAPAPDLQVMPIAAITSLRIYLGSYRAGAGATIGIPMALLCAKLVTSLSTLLFGLQPDDPPTIAAMALLLVCLAAIAGYFPARRAARLDPMKALRNE
jgi:ABC-type antimicrobial peptide transport system permease subunit